MSSMLPGSFKSLYRLFLRTSSAAVLGHNHGVQNLRRLWRPTFSEAASVVRQLQRSPSNELPLQRWLKDWQDRMDNTLMFLYNSATTRGLPHDLTQNLNLLIGHEHSRLSQRMPSWKPNISNEERIKQNARAEKYKEKEKARNDFQNTAWAHVGHVVRMAEGTGSLSFGRMMAKGKIKN